MEYASFPAFFAQLISKVQPLCLTSRDLQDLKALNTIAMQDQARSFQQFSEIVINLTQRMKRLGGSKLTSLVRSTLRKVVMQLVNFKFQQLKKKLAHQWAGQLRTNNCQNFLTLVSKLFSVRININKLAFFSLVKRRIMEQDLQFLQTHQQLSKHIQVLVQIHLSFIEAKKRLSLFRWKQNSRQLRKEKLMLLTKTIASQQQNIYSTHHEQTSPHRIIEGLLQNIFGGGRYIEYFQLYRQAYLLQRQHLQNFKLTNLHEKSIQSRKPIVQEGKLIYPIEGRQETIALFQFAELETSVELVQNFVERIKPVLTSLRDLKTQVTQNPMTHPSSSLKSQIQRWSAQMQNFLLDTISKEECLRCLLGINIICVKYKHQGNVIQFPSPIKVTQEQIYGLSKEIIRQNRRYILLQKRKLVCAVHDHGWTCLQLSDGGVRIAKETNFCQQLSSFLYILSRDEPIPEVVQKPKICDLQSLKQVWQIVSNMQWTTNFEQVVEDFYKCLKKLFNQPYYGFLEVWQKDSTWTIIEGEKKQFSHSYDRQLLAFQKSDRCHPLFDFPLFQNSKSFELEHKSNKVVRLAVQVPGAGVGRLAFFNIKQLQGDEIIQLHQSFFQLGRAFSYVFKRPELKLNRPQPDYYQQKIRRLVTKNIAFSPKILFEKECCQLLRQCLNGGQVTCHPYKQTYNQRLLRCFREKLPVFQNFQIWQDQDAQVIFATNLTVDLGMGRSAPGKNTGAVKVKERVFILSKQTGFLKQQYIMLKMSIPFLESLSEESRKVCAVEQNQIKAQALLSIQSRIFHKLKVNQQRVIQKFSQNLRLQRKKRDRLKMCLQRVWLFTRISLKTHLNIHKIARILKLYYRLNSNFIKREAFTKILLRNSDLKNKKKRLEIANKIILKAVSWSFICISRYADNTIMSTNQKRIIAFQQLSIISNNLLKKFKTNALFLLKVRLRRSTQLWNQLGEQLSCLIQLNSSQILEIISNRLQVYYEYLKARLQVGTQSELMIKYPSCKVRCQLITLDGQLLPIGIILQNKSSSLIELAKVNSFLGQLNSTFKKVSLRNSLNVKSLVGCLSQPLTRVLQSSFDSIFKFMELMYIQQIQSLKQNKESIDEQLKQIQQRCQEARHLKREREIGFIQINQITQDKQNLLSALQIQVEVKKKKFAAQKACDILILSEFRRMGLRLGFQGLLNRKQTILGVIRQQGQSSSIVVHREGVRILSNFSLSMRRERLSVGFRQIAFQ